MTTYQQLYPESCKQLTSNNLFDTIATNHDGTVDFNEFLFLVAV
ncbi:unnamed protein product, partial [Rotaria magnacalcarata]